MEPRRYTCFDHRRRVLAVYVNFVNLKNLAEIDAVVSIICKF